MRLWDEEAVENDNAAWDGAEADDNPPHLVNNKLAIIGAEGRVDSILRRSLEARGDDQGNHGGSELPNTQNGKDDGSHRGISTLSSSEFGCNDGRKWMIATYKVSTYIL